MAEEIEVSSVVSGIYLLHYYQLAAFVVTFYDHFLTFDQELEPIWKKHWSKSKVLYLLCRYVGNILIFWQTFVYLNLHPTYEVSVWGVRVMTSLGITCSWIIQLIMQFRIQALYNNRMLSKCLSAVFIGEVVGLATIGFLILQGTIVTHERFPGIYQCIGLKFPFHSFMLWVLILFFDTLMFILAVGIVIRNWCRLLQGSVPEIGTSLLTILLRDNFGYFFLAFGIYLTTTVVWLVADTRYFAIPACFSYSIVTVMSCRFILNLCDAYHNPRNYLTRGASEWDTKPLEFNTIHLSKSTTNTVNGVTATVYFQNTAISGSEDGVELSIVSGLAERATAENQPKELAQHTQT